MNQPMIQSCSFYKPSWLPVGPGGTRTVFWRKTFVHDLSSQAVKSTTGFLTSISAMSVEELRAEDYQVWRDGRTGGTSVFGSPVQSPSSTRSSSSADAVTPPSLSILSGLSAPCSPMNY
ncbi:hypothetical protein ABPG77_000359 [Micractinium sp. CCAP 211/92]